MIRLPTIIGAVATGIGAGIFWFGSFALALHPAQQLGEEAALELGHAVRQAKQARQEARAVHTARLSAKVLSRARPSMDCDRYQEQRVQHAVNDWPVAEPTVFPLRPGYDELLIDADRIGELLEVVYYDGRPENIVEQFQVTVPDLVAENGLVRVPLPVARNHHAVQLDGEYVRALAERPSFPVDCEKGEWLAAYSLRSGCFFSATAERWFRPVDDHFVDREGVVVSRERVLGLRERILATRPERGATQNVDEILEAPEAFLAQVGVTSERFEAEREALLASCIDPHWQAPEGEPVEVPASVRDAFTFDERKLPLARWLLRTEGSTSSCSHLLRFPGEVPLVVGTNRPTPDGLPWFVQHGDASWYVADRELARDLLELRAVSSTIRTRPADPDHRYASVWRTSGMLGDLRQQIDVALSERSLEAVAGYAGMAARYSVVSFIPSPYFEPHLPRYLRLKAVDERAIDRIFGSFLYASTWFDLHRLIDTLEPALAEMSWIEAWKRRTGGWVELRFIGNNWDGHDDEGLRLARYAWIAHRLGGDRPFVLRFFVRGQSKRYGNNDEVVASVLAGEDGTLLFCGTSDKARHLYEGLGKTSIVRDDEYYLLRRGGELEACRLEEDARESMEAARRSRWQSGCATESMD